MAEKFVFAPAAREEIKAKISIQGSSGSGKTTTALLVAYGLCGDWRRIAVADTENDSAKQYCGQTFGDTRIPSGADSFHHCRLQPPYGCDRLVELISQVEAAGCFDVLVFDTLSHSWNGAGGVLEMVDQIGKLEGWKRMTPKFRRLIDAVRLSSLHVVATMRTRTKYDIETTVLEGGRQKIVGVKKIGTEPEMRDGVDYEFTTVFALDQDHMATVSKDRTNLFAGRPPSLLGPETGKVMADWCGGAVCQIGSAEWIKLRLADLQSYSGSLEGLATLWRGVGAHKARIGREDWEVLFAAKEASKARLTSG